MSAKPPPLLLPEAAVLSAQNREHAVNSTADAVIQHVCDNNYTAVPPARDNPLTHLTDFVGERRDIGNEDNWERRSAGVSV